VSLLERRPVRNLGQLQGFPQLGPLRHDTNGFAIVGLQELTQGQQGEQLRLREVLSTQRAGVRRQTLVPDAQGHLDEIERRLGHGPHGFPPLRLHGSFSAYS